MKLLLSATAFLLIAAAIPVNAREVKCQGELYRSTLPVSNYPTHIRNVIWHNAWVLRENCQKQVAQATSNGTPNAKREPSQEKPLSRLSQTQLVH